MWKLRSLHPGYVNKWVRITERAMKELIRSAWEIEAPDFAACIAYGQHVEDTGTIDALVAHSERKMTCVDCLDLWIDEGIVKVGANQIIRANVCPISEGMDGR